MVGERVLLSWWGGPLYVRGTAGEKNTMFPEPYREPVGYKMSRIKI